MNKSLLLTFLLSQFTFIIIIIILHFSSFNLLEAYGINETQRNYSIDFDKLVAEYLNWWVNLPFEEDPQQLDNPCVIQKTDSIIFLQDPFEMGNIKNICTIPHKSLFFPFYVGWCDNGSQGIYGTNSYKELLECTLDANRGIVAMDAYLDDKKIVDLLIDNTNVHNLKVLSNNSLDNYYQQIGPTDIFTLIVTNKTQYTYYEKPQDFASSPAKYKAIAYCFCGFIDKDKISPGTHQLSYHTKIEGSGGLDKTKGWDHESTITYSLTVE
jgi:hypothetical protein